MKGGSYGLLIYQRTATRINQDGGILHLLQTLLIDEMIGVIRKRTMERENIARGKQTLLAHLLDPLRQIARILAGAGTDVHAKLAGDVGNLHADIAQSHDTQGLAGKLHQWGIPITEILIVSPALVAVLLGVMLYAVGYGKDEGEGHLRHAIRAVGRNIGYDDALFPGSLDVYHVETCSLYTDVFQFRKLRQRLCIYLHLVQKDDVGILGTFHFLCI